MTAVVVVLAGSAVWFAVPTSSSSRVRHLLAMRPREARERGPWPMLAVAAPVVGIVLLGPMVGVPVAAAVLLLARRWRGSVEPASARRRRARAAEQLPRALDLVVAALEAGRPPSSALALVAAAVAPPLAEDLESVAARLRVAPDPRVVWDDLASDPVLGETGRAFRRAEASGMPVARVVREVAVERRRVQQAERRERGRRVAVKTAAPLGLCFLPAFFLVGVVPTVMGVFAGLDLGVG